MFWGLIIDSNKKYSQTIENSFHISMASLDVNKASEGNVQVSVSYEGTSYLLCTLNKNSPMQQPLDLEFKAGTKISFSCNGNGRVHLTGFVSEEDDDMFDQLDENDSLEESDEEIPNLVPVDKKRKAKAEKNEKQNQIKKAKLAKDESLDIDDSDSDDDDYNEELGNLEEDSDNDDDDDEDGEEDEDDEDDDDNEDDEVEEKKIEKVTKKPAKTEVTIINGKDAKPAKENKNQKKNKDKKDNKAEDKSDQQQQQQQKKRVIEGGVQIEDIRLGHGAPAKTGKFVGVYYIGRLKNGKKFDQTTSGDGFKFRLGKSEVIKGWDVGIVGMKIGGKRRITIPANMGYGSKGSPPVIPPNSQLIFEVELKSVN